MGVTAAVTKVMGATKPKGLDPTGKLMSALLLRGIATSCVPCAMIDPVQSAMTAMRARVVGFALNLGNMFALETFFRLGTLGRSQEDHQD